MAIKQEDIYRLGPGAKLQIMEQLAKKERKLHNRPTSVETAGGTIKFDSAKEARRYKELAIMERLGKIRDLRLQVPFELIPKAVRADGKTERACKYVADFAYYTTGGSPEYVVEDVKGMRDPSSAVYRVFAIKRKLMLEKYGITVREV